MRVLAERRTRVQSDEVTSASVIPTSDSTVGGISGIDSRYIKKAALYARVSGDLQTKEGTVESQVLALKKQIEAAGHVLVKDTSTTDVRRGLVRQWVRSSLIATTVLPPRQVGDWPFCRQATR